jgi:predicted enzyme related to lactoylglutathione lyase
MSALKNPVGWFEIYVSDLLRAKRFYETLFNQPLHPLPSDDPSIEMMVFGGDLASHGTTGALVKHSMKQPSTEGALVYFSCVDCADQEKLALANGGKVFKAKFSIGPNGFISIIGDSEGNAIGLHSFQ